MTVLSKLAFTFENFGAFSVLAITSLRKANTNMSVMSGCVNNCVPVACQALLNNFMRFVINGSQKNQVLLDSS